ncbi:MAG: hypothetical protein ACKVJK_18940 [Methylophagaceae bacterium]|jgi:hypothetical protein|tara:strand:- start:1379 stop:1585 length:207 start_codon:yes stop_codon:yes gene_type:complete
MVKKIRLIEDEVSDDELDTQDMQKQWMELAKSMDWKLWELLQTMQRLERNLTVLGGDSSESENAKSKK